MRMSLSAQALLVQHSLHAEAILLDDGTTLQLQADVRLVPTRRLVCQAMWQNQTVYAKLFFGHGAEEYARRDQQGVEAIQRARIQTPSILACSRVCNKQIYVLIFEAIESSQHAEAFYTQALPKARLELVQQLVTIVAKQHQAGLIQTDMYLKNFLVTSSIAASSTLQATNIYSIDGDGIRQMTRLSQSRALHNLSVLLSKIDVIELQQHLKAWLDVYATQRGWLSAPSINRVKKLIHDARWKATIRYADHKVFRQCTDVEVKQDAMQFMAMARSFAKNAEVMTASTVDALIDRSTILKDGNTCTVSLATLADQSVVIKRYNIKSIWHWLSRMWRPSRAAVSWANAHRLQLLDVPTPKPAALFETRIFGLRGKAYFISEYLDAPDLAESFALMTDSSQRAALVKAVVQLCYRLWLLQISHGDFKATNIKVLAVQPVLIDLDSMQQHRCSYFANRAHVKDLQRLMQNWKDNTSLYNAFVQSFKVIYHDHTPLKQANILSD